MRAKEIFLKYGEEMYNKIIKDEFMRGITLTMYPDGETDIPEEDVERAVRHIKGQRIVDWD